MSVAGGVLAPAARATSGGATIASAPQLPIGATFVGGAVGYNEYWRVTLAAGDTLTIDYQPVNDSSEVDLHFFKPSVTDSTLGSASSVISDRAYGQSQFTWTATGQGSWILEVYSHAGYQLTTKVTRTSYAQAAAGSSIAAAPQLPIGATFVGGAVDYNEYWRVTLAAGDTLTIDYQPVNDSSEVDLSIFKPSVTDSTLGSASSVISDRAYGQSEFTWTATGQGSWTLIVYSHDGYQLTTKVTRTSYAQAAAGSSIAAAPQLPIGATFVGGAVDYNEYWRVTLAAGDTLTIRYQPLNDSSEVDLSIYKPSVTDYTLGGASSVASDRGYDPAKFTWTATGQGSWILIVYSHDGYQLTAQVQHVKITRLSPTSGRRGVIATITGRYFGTRRGTSYVKFGSAKCTKYVSWNATRITCRVPAKAKFGKLKVTVVTVAGTSNARTFTVKR